MCFQMCVSPVCALASGSRAVILTRFEALGVLCELLDPGARPVLVGLGASAHPRASLRAAGRAEASMLVSSSHAARRRPLLLSLLSGQFLCLLLCVGTHL